MLPMTPSGEIARPAIAIRGRAIDIPHREQRQARVQAGPARNTDGLGEAGDDYPSSSAPKTARLARPRTSKLTQCCPCWGSVDARTSRQSTPFSLARWSGSALHSPRELGREDDCFRRRRPGMPTSPRTARRSCSACSHSTHRSAPSRSLPHRPICRN